MHRGVLLTHSLNSYWAGDHGYHLQHRRLIRSRYHACLSLVYLGLCPSVKRLSVRDVNMDGSCLLALAQMTACYAIISETNLHCSHLAALSASVASACAASVT